MFYVDGRLIRRMCVRRSTKDSHITVLDMKFMEDGSMYRGQLKFTVLVSPFIPAFTLLKHQKTTDNDDEVSLGAVQLQCLGKIRVDFLRANLGDVVNSTTSDCLVSPDVGVAAEKGKKYVKTVPNRLLG
jgi:hypothetical protein